MQIIIKIVTTAIVIGIITEIARRFPLYGGLIAALPLISILSIIWLKVQGEQMGNIQQFTLGVLIGIPATVVMLIVIYFGLKHSLHITVTLACGLLAWGLFLMGQKMIVNFISSIHA